MPNHEEQPAILKDHQGHAVALQGVQVRARLHGLLAEVEVEQRYRNVGRSNIEAVYTFPLPMGATLLGLEVEIAGKKLAGRVVEKKQAERAYEEAVTDGDSVVMIEEAGPGLYTASLGNLMAKESAVIRYRYALLLSWQGSRLRFLLPTTIAPRYGDAIAAGLKPHQVPGTSLEAEYPLDVEITVEGELAAAAISSPTHGITCARADKGTQVRLSGQAVLDRDFVLVLESKAAQSSCVLTADRDGHVALASLRIPPATGNESTPLALKIVIDCSGSMAGVSIAQARKAALEILNLLGRHDRFNVTLFGSRHRHLFKNMVPATAQHITKAWNELDVLAADLGGTEMEQALEGTFDLECPEGGATVLLITDGEIHAHEQLVKRAGASGQRVFTVGVGTSVSDTFLQSLARITGGACELVAPQEGMTERVLAQFHRMRQPRLGKLTMAFPETPIWMTALPDTVFAGDTVHVFAGFAAPVAGHVVLEVRNDTGVIELAAPLVAEDQVEIPRIAAARRMLSCSDAEGLRLALDYQLLSRWTNFLVIAERADKAADLPELHHVPQMLAAGWGGTSVVREYLNFESLDSPVMSRSVRAGMPAPQLGFADPAARPLASVVHAMGSSLKRLFRPDEPASVHSLGELISEQMTSKGGSSARFLESCRTTLGSLIELPQTIDELLALGLDAEVGNELRRWVTDGNSEARVVAAFLYALSQSGIRDTLDRRFKRAVIKRWKEMGPESVTSSPETGYTPPALREKRP
ncbi:MAG: VIT domain-containing protein [Betaproteobacteria bacterium]